MIEFIIFLYLASWLWAAQCGTEDAPNDSYACEVFFLIAPFAIVGVIFYWHIL